MERATADAILNDAFVAHAGGAAYFQHAVERLVAEHGADADGSFTSARQLLYAHAFRRLRGDDVPPTARCVSVNSVAASASYYVAEGAAPTEPRSLDTVLVAVSVPECAEQRDTVILLTFAGVVRAYDYPLAGAASGTSSRRHRIERRLVQPLSVLAGDAAAATTTVLPFDLSVLSRRFEVRDASDSAEPTAPPGSDAADTAEFAQHMHAMLTTHCVNMECERPLQRGAAAKGATRFRQFAIDSNESLLFALSQPWPRRYDVLLRRLAYEARVDLQAHVANFVTDMLAQTFAYACDIYYGDELPRMQYVADACAQRLPTALCMAPDGTPRSFRCAFVALFNEAPRTATVVMERGARAVAGHVYLRGAELMQAAAEMYERCMRVATMPDEDKRRRRVADAERERAEELARLARRYTPDEDEPALKRVRTAPPFRFSAQAWRDIESSLPGIDLGADVASDAALRIGLKSNRPDKFFGIRVSVDARQLARWNGARLSEYSLLIPQLVHRDVAPPHADVAPRHWRYSGVFDLDAFDAEAVEALKMGERNMFRTWGPRDCTFGHTKEIKTFFVRHGVAHSGGDARALCAESTDFAALFEALREFTAALDAASVPFVAFFSGGKGFRVFVWDRSLWASVDEDAKYGATLLERIVRPFVARVYAAAGNEAGVARLSRFIDANSYDRDKGVKPDIDAHQDTGNYCVDVSAVRRYASLSDYFDSADAPCLLSRARPDCSLVLAIHSFWRRFMLTSAPPAAELYTAQHYVPVEAPEAPAPQRRADVPERVCSTELSRALRDARTATPYSSGLFSRRRSRRFDGDAERRADLPKRYKLKEGTAEAARVAARSASGGDGVVTVWSNSERRKLRLDTRALSALADSPDPIDELLRQRSLPLCVANAEKRMRDGTYLKYSDRNTYALFMHEMVRVGALADIEECATHQCTVMEAAGAELAESKANEHRRHFAEAPRHYAVRHAKSARHLRDRRSMTPEAAEAAACGSVSCGELCSTKVVPAPGDADKQLQCPYMMVHRGYMSQSAFDGLLAFSGVDEESERRRIGGLARAGRYALACTTQFEASGVAARSAHDVDLKYPRQYTWLAAHEAVRGGDPA